MDLNYDILLQLNMFIVTIFCLHVEKLGAMSLACKLQAQYNHSITEGLLYCVTSICRSGINGNRCTLHSTYTGSQMQVQ